MSIPRIVQLLTNSSDIEQGSLKMLNNDIARIHAGQFFTVAFKQTLTAGATSKVTMLTPAAEVGTIHYRPALFACSADKLTLGFYEGASEATGGDTVNPVNHNRNATSTNGMIVKTGVTVAENGTKISEAYIPGAVGVGGTRNGGDFGATTEWLLKPSTLYVITYANGSSEANDVFTELQWYE